MDPRGLRGGRASILVSTASVLCICWFGWFGLDGWMDGWIAALVRSIIP